MVNRLGNRSIFIFMCVIRISSRHVQRLIATPMASRQLRKRGKSNNSKGKRPKISYENLECDTSAISASGGASSWAPKNWREQYDNIKKMRETSDAPVDIVGASKLADTSALPEVDYVEILIKHRLKLKPGAIIHSKLIVP